MREPPGFAGKLAKRLSQPTRQPQIVEVAEALAVFLPELVEWSIGVSGHRCGSLAQPGRLVEPGSHGPSQCSKCQVHGLYLALVWPWCGLGVALVWPWGFERGVV